MTIEEICNKYIKVKATGILALHQHPKQDWAFKVVSGKESDGYNDCFLEKYYPLRLPYTCAAHEREDGKNVQFKKISKTMTREEAKEQLPIIQALAEGKTIEVLHPNGGWTESDKVYFNLPSNHYRIKEEPKYRPFKNKEECWNEMLKHQPFGWVKEISSEMLYLINGISNMSIVIMEDINSFKKAMNIYEFKDGTPFGIKKEG